ncbi:MAG: NfeD family protein [Alphaproteobacteria bacterium]|nr:NfeD family protein [Alphaproteobacteria bacterium]
MDGIEFWHWLSLGGILVAVEILAPGVYFLWLGIAALLVGGVSWIWPELHWQYQVLLFAAFSVADIWLSRRFVRRHPIETDRPYLNRRGEQYVGRTFTLSAPIVDGVGRLHVGDTMWRIAGPDLPTGARVTVKGVDGATLLVDLA